MRKTFKQNSSMMQLDGGGQVKLANLARSLSVRPESSVDEEGSSQMRTQSSSYQAALMMSQQQFGDVMGVIGVQSKSFLSERIFSVADSDLDGYISFIEFLSIMDIMIHGNEEMKSYF